MPVPNVKCTIRFDFAEHFEVEESLDGTIEPTPGPKPQRTKTYLLYLLYLQYVRYTYSTFSTYSIYSYGLREREKEGKQNKTKRGEVRREDSSLEPTDD